MAAIGRDGISACGCGFTSAGIVSCAFRGTAGGAFVSVNGVGTVADTGIEIIDASGMFVFLISGVRLERIEPSATSAGKESDMNEFWRVPHRAPY